MRKIEKNMNQAIRNRKEHWQSSNTSVKVSTVPFLIG